MNVFVHRFPPVFCSALIFLLAVAVHVLFFAAFRPVEEKDIKRAPKGRYTVMYHASLHKGTDPLKLNYWFRIDSGSAFAEPSMRTGFSKMVSTGGFMEKNVIQPDQKEKASAPFFPVSSPRRSDELQEFSPLPIEVPISTARQFCASGEGRFTGWDGLPVPGWETEKVTVAETGTGTVVFAVSGAGKLLPPTVRIEHSSGSPEFDRAVRKLLIRRLLKDPPSAEKGTARFIFETGGKSVVKGKESLP